MRCSYAVGVYRKKRRKRLQSVKGLDERERERIERNGEKKILKKKEQRAFGFLFFSGCFFYFIFMANRRRSEISSHENKSTLCLLSFGTS